MYDDFDFSDSLEELKKEKLSYEGEEDNQEVHIGQPEEKVEAKTPFIKKKWLLILAGIIFVCVLAYIFVPKKGEFKRVDFSVKYTERSPREVVLSFEVPVSAVLEQKNYNNSYNLNSCRVKIEEYEDITVTFDRNTKSDYKSSDLENKTVGDKECLHYLLDRSGNLSTHIYFFSINDIPMSVEGRCKKKQEAEYLRYMEKIVATLKLDGVATIAKEMTTFDNKDYSCLLLPGMIPIYKSNSKSGFLFGATEYGVFDGYTELFELQQLLPRYDGEIQNVVAFRYVNKSNGISTHPKMDIIRVRPWGEYDTNSLVQGLKNKFYSNIVYDDIYYGGDNTLIDQPVEDCEISTTDLTAASYIGTEVRAEYKNGSVIIHRVLKSNSKIYIVYMEYDKHVPENEGIAKSLLNSIEFKN